jgi:hypothetical protein
MNDPTTDYVVFCGVPRPRGNAGFEISVEARPQLSLGADAK